MSEIRKRPLKNRIGDYETYVTDMVKETAKYQLPDGENKGQNPLINADLGHDNTFLHGIYRSWASVLEVLTFYQEQIAKEGYLSTATEDFSFRKLKDTIGIAPSYTLAATTYLSFTLRTNAEKKEYLIPKSTQAQNIPSGGQPVIFETLYDFIGRPSWNELALIPNHAPQTLYSLSTKSTFCRIETTKYLLKPQTKLLIQGMIGKHIVEYVVTLTKIIKEKAGTILISWDRPLSHHGSQKEIISPTLHHFADKLAILGHDAPVWKLQSSDFKKKAALKSSKLLVKSPNRNDWIDLSQSAPEMELYCLLTVDDNTILAGGSKGLYISHDTGNSWHKTLDKKLMVPILCLHKNNGTLYAGSTNGFIFMSIDLGTNWQMILGNKPSDPKIKEDISPGILPKIDILCIESQSLSIWWEGDTRHILYIGTSNGLYYSMDNGYYWQQAEGLFHYDNGYMPTGLAVYHLHIEDKHLTACTNKGLFFSKITEYSLQTRKDPNLHGRNAMPWRNIVHFFEGTTRRELAKTNLNTHVYTAIHWEDADDKKLIFSTEEGIFHWQQGKWINHSKGMIPDEKDKLPRVYNFYIYKKALLAVTDRGLYSLDSLEETWTLIAKQTICSLSDIQAWTQSFASGIIAEEMKATCSNYGYILTDKATITKGDTPNQWIIHVPNAAPITINTSHHSIELNFNNQSVLTIYSSTSYINDLTNNRTLSSRWIQLFNDNNIHISKHTSVYWHEYQHAFVILDTEQRLTFLVKEENEKTTLSLVTSGTSITSRNDETIITIGKEKHLIPTEWPNYDLDEDSLPLQHKISAQKLGSTLLLMQNESWQRMASCHIESNLTQMVDLFGKQQNATILKTDKPVVKFFDRRHLNVYANCTPLQLLSVVEQVEIPQQTKPLIIEKEITPFESGHKVAIKGMRPLMQFTVTGSHHKPTTNILSGVTEQNQRVDLSRNLLFSLEIDHDIEQALRQGTIHVKLNQLFAEHHIQFSSKTTIYPLSEYCFYIQQQNQPNYLIYKNQVSNNYDIEQEYYFPVISDEKDYWCILHNNQVLHIAKDSSISPAWLLQPSKSSVSEIAEVFKCQRNNKGHYILTLNSSLKHLYHTQSLKIYGNIVKAVHGQSITHEVLGSIESGKTLQHFPLKRKPLAVYVDQNGQTNHMIDIMIRRTSPWHIGNATFEQWHRTESLLNSSTHQRHYQLVPSENNTISVMFGNGTYGQMPHTGTENVVATYRFGGGNEGNLPEGSIKILRAKIAGIRSVINPVDATGGADRPNEINHLHSIKNPLLQINSLVTIHDCLHFAQQYEGVIGASLDKVMIDGESISVICIATNASTYTARQIIQQNLQKSIHEKLCSSYGNIRVVLADIDFFWVEATLYLKSFENWDQHEQKIKQTITHYFTTKHHTSGQSIEPARIIALIQSHELVEEVILTELKRNDPKYHEDSTKPLLAKPIEYDSISKNLKGAELLITSPVHITLNIGNHHE